MQASLNELIAALAKQLDVHIERHAHNKETFVEHISSVRRKRAHSASSKHIIYLDTNALKCLADHNQGKQNLTASMIAFCQAAKDAVASGNFIFPIGLPSFFELDSMSDPKTHESLVSFVDQLCKGYCLAPFSEVLFEEISRVKSDLTSDSKDLSLYLRSPVELLGISKIELNQEFSGDVDREIYKKAFYDTLIELPFSAQLKIAREAPGPRWDNSKSISELNDWKIKHQSEIPNLNRGIFVELKGIIATCFENEGIAINAQDCTRLTACIQYFWHQNPTSIAFPTLRTLAGLHGLMRFDKQRKYQQGDLADFMAAAAALPIAESMFTDRRLAIILREKSLGFENFSKCEIVNGFEEMAKYLLEKIKA